jgi:hypothetical protein
MKLDLNPEKLRTSMDLWRKAVDLEMPINDDFKLHFITQRQKLLAGFVSTATAFSIVLRGCEADGFQDLVDLDALKQDVADFKKWAEDGLAEMRRLGSEEVAADQRKTR